MVWHQHQEFYKQKWNSGDCGTYDDIVVYGKDKAEVCQRLLCVLKRLDNAGLIVK